MKSQKKRLIGIVAGSLLLGSAGAALAFGGHGYDREGCDHDRPMHALQQLDNVTDEQREQLKKMFDEQRDTMRERRGAMHEGRKAVREAIRRGASTEEIRALATKQGEQVTAIIMAKAEMRQKMATILTKEQMKALQDSRSEKMEKRERW
jgi:Spy/CpxP family protein refolding chaperone